MNRSKDDGSYRKSSFASKTHGYNYNAPPKREVFYPREKSGDAVRVKHRERDFLTKQSGPREEFRPRNSYKDNSQSSIKQGYFGRDRVMDAQSHHHKDDFYSSYKERDFQRGPRGRGGGMLPSKITRGNYSNRQNNNFNSDRFGPPSSRNRDDFRTHSSDDFYGSNYNDKNFRSQFNSRGRGGQFPSHRGSFRQTSFRGRDGPNMYRDSDAYQEYSVRDSNPRMKNLRGFPTARGRPTYGGTFKDGDLYGRRPMQDKPFVTRLRTLAYDKGGYDRPIKKVTSRYPQSPPLQISSQLNYQKLSRRPKPSSGHAYKESKTSVSRKSKRETDEDWVDLGKPKKRSRHYSGDSPARISKTTDNSLRSKKTDKKRSGSQDRLDEEGRSVKDKGSKKLSDKVSLESSELSKKKSRKQSSEVRHEDEEEEEAAMSSRAASESRRPPAKESNRHSQESEQHSSKRHRKNDLQKGQNQGKDSEPEQDKDSDQERNHCRDHRTSSGGERHSSRRRHRSGSGVRSPGWRLASTQSSLFIDLRCPICPGQKSFSFRDYRYHLDSRNHRYKLDKLTHQHTMVLRRIRLQQRTELKEMEEQWEKDKPEEFADTESKYCTVCKLAFKCKMDDDGREDISKHQESKLHKAQQRYLRPKCSMCQMTFPSRMVYELHIASIRHLKMMALSRQNAGRSSHSPHSDVEAQKEKREEGSRSDTSKKNKASSQDEDDLDLTNFVMMDSIEAEEEDIEAEKEEITGNLEDLEKAEEDAKEGDEDDDKEEQEEGDERSIGGESPDDDNEIDFEEVDHGGEFDNEGEHLEPQGKSYVIPFEGLYCKLCHRVLRIDPSEDHEDALERHCRSTSHLDHFFYEREHQMMQEEEDDDDDDLAESEVEDDLEKEAVDDDNSRRREIDSDEEREKHSDTDGRDSEGDANDENEVESNFDGKDADDDVEEEQREGNEDIEGVNESEEEEEEEEEMEIGSETLNNRTDSNRAGSES